MGKWVNPYNEGDEEYDHSAGSVFLGLKQAVKTIVILLLVLFAILAFTVIAYI